MKWWVLPLISLPVCGYLGFKFGLIFGEDSSPLYDNAEIASIQFIMRNAAVRQNSDGDVIENSDAGWKNYEYHSRSDHLEITPLIAQVLAYQPKRQWKLEDLDKVDSLTGVAALTEGGILVKLKNSTSLFRDAQTLASVEGKPNAWPIVAVLIVGSMIGSGIGYYMGHEDKIDMNDEKIQKQMAEKTGWRLLANQYIRCRVVEHLVANTDASTFGADMRAFAAASAEACRRFFSH
jgi:hypothetical protein